MCKPFFILALFVTTLVAESPLVTLDGVGTRSSGMANNFTAVANDYSAIFWNPAGLAFLPVREMHLSVGNNLLRNTSELNHVTTDYKKSIVRLQSAGFVRSLPTTRGGFSLAVGYSSPYNFAEIDRYAGTDVYVDKDSMLINKYGSDTLFHGEELTYDDVKYFSNGKLGLWSAAAGWQVAEQFGVGFTVSFIKGHLTSNYSILSHTHKGTFDDRAEMYSETDYNGIDVRLGGLYKVTSRAAVGIRLEIPQWIRFTQTAHEDGYVDKIDGELRSSLTAALGGAYTFPFATLTLDGYFRAPNPDIDEGDLAYWKVGAGSGLEIPIKQINTIVRAGYTWKEYDLYPYAEYIDHLIKIDTENTIDGSGGTHLISGGVTFIVSTSVLIDLAYTQLRYASTMESRDWLNTVEKKSTNHRGSVTVSIRY
jgi:hypothetical protein